MLLKMELQHIGLIKTGIQDVNKTLGARKWLKRIANYDEESQDSSEFFETIKSDLFNDEVYVFTPKGTSSI